LLTGTYCVLEPLRPELHTASLFSTLVLETSAENWRYLPYGPFLEIDSFSAWIKTVTGGNDPLLFAIIDKVSRRALGVAGYLRIDARNGTIEIGHLNFSTLLKRSRVATEALYLLMANAFDLGNRRCEWKSDALNLASRRAAQRMGFTFEGVFRQAAVVKGINRDTAWYSIIDREWPSLDETIRRWLAPINFDEHGVQRNALSEVSRMKRSNLSA
jgi:RimJ/RimL family protein N-acetyltransferase